MRNDWTSSGTVRRDTTGRSEAGGRGLWGTPHTFWACERVPKWGGVAGRPESQPGVSPDVTSTITPGASCPSPLHRVFPKRTAASAQVCLAGFVTPFSLCSEVTLQVGAGRSDTCPPTPPSLQLDDRAGFGPGERGSPSGSCPGAWRGEGQGWPAGALPTSSPSVLVSPDPELSLQSLLKLTSVPVLSPLLRTDVGGTPEGLLSGVLARAASGEPAGRRPGSWGVKATGSQPGHPEAAAAWGPHEVGQSRL